MKVTVECYSGRNADERPVRFWLGATGYQAEAVLDQWYEPENIFYKVRAVDGNHYILRQQNPTSDRRWELVSFRQAGIRAKHPEFSNGHPHLASVPCKIESTHEYASERQKGSRDVGLDKLVRIAEQKPALVRLNPTLSREPVLKHG